jgi:hypothetical protein
MAINPNDTVPSFPDLATPGPCTFSIRRVFREQGVHGCQSFSKQAFVRRQGCNRDPRNQLHVHLPSRFNLSTVGYPHSFQTQPGYFNLGKAGFLLRHRHNLTPIIRPAERIPVLRNPF